MGIASIATAILAGPVIGALGRLVLPGTPAISWIATFALGLVGAFARASLVRGLDLDVWRHVLIVQAVVAAVLVFLFSGWMRSRSNASAR